MPKITFTPASINAIRLSPSADKEVFTDRKHSGLQLIVKWKPGAIRGARSLMSDFRFDWFVRYQINVDPPVRSQIKIGEYPELNISDAGHKADEIKRQSSAGIDPKAVVYADRSAKFESRSRHSSISVVPKFRIENVIKVWEGEWSKTKNKLDTFEKYKRTLELHLLTDHEGRDIRTITSHDWDDMVLTLANQKNKPGAAKNLHKAGRALFTFCVRHGYLAYNPALQRKEVLDSTRLTEDRRFFESQELHKFLTELWDQPIAEWAKYNFELMLRCGVRIEEWERVKIGWINYKAMRIEHPAESMKGGEAVWTYLPKPAMELLADWLRVYKKEWGALEPDWYLFPGATPLSQKTVALSDEVKKIRGWMPFVPKMIRKTISTHLQRQGASPVVGRVIRNQALVQGVERSYDFDKLYHLKVEWINKWNDLLEQVRKNPKALITEHDIAPDSELSSQFDDIFG